MFVITADSCTSAVKQPTFFHGFCMCGQQICVLNEYKQTLTCSAPNMLFKILQYD